MKQDLFLFFPQWQGSGPSTELWTGAQTLRQHLPSIPFREIPVSLDPITGAVHDIFGHEALLAQQQAAHRLVKEEAPERIFSLGGDCGIELVPVSWLNQRYEEGLAVVWLDAHGDLNSPYSSPSQHFHGMPLRFLLEKERHPFDDVLFSRILPSQVLLAGTRDLDPPESRYIEESGIALFRPEALEANPALLSRHMGAKGMPNGYLHIDLDVLDPAAFPGVKCPTPGGLSIETLRSVIRNVKADCNLVGCSFVEYVEGRDDTGPRTIQGLIQEIIGDWLI